MPQKAASDNGQQYASHDFHIAKEVDFNYATSSPKYRQSSGLVEKTVQIAIV